MADNSREVYSWPEARMYLATAGANPGSGELAFVEDLSINVTWNWRKDVSPASASWAARTNFTLQGKEVQISISRMWDGGAFFAQAQSATAFNFTISAGGGADGITAAYSVWSAVFPSWGLQGSQDDGLFRNNVAIMAADISGVED